MPKTAPKKQPGHLLDFDANAQPPLTDAQTIALIEGYIANPSRPSVDMTITPGVAQHILDTYNKGNRSKKPSKIEEYRRDMATANWQDTRDPLKFSDAKILRDGQNRLYACVKAGVPFDTQVVFGVPDAAYRKMDQGKNRSGSDVLQIAGYTDTSALSAAVRWVHLFSTGRVKQRDTFSPDQILTFLEDLYPGLTEHMIQAGRIYKLTGQPKGLVAALLHLQAKANPEKAAEWAAGWEAGKDGGTFKPLGLVTRRLAEIKRASQGPVQDIVRVALLVQAWNLFVSGRKGVQADIGWTAAEEFPAING